MWAFRLNCVPYYLEAEGRGRNDKFFLKIIFLKVRKYENKLIFI